MAITQFSAVIGPTGEVSVECHVCKTYLPSGRGGIGIEDFFSNDFDINYKFINYLFSTLASDQLCGQLDEFAELLERLRDVKIQAASKALAELFSAPIRALASLAHPRATAAHAADRPEPLLRPPGGQTDFYIPLC